MAVYVPAKNPQSTEYGDAALIAQVRDYQAFGPPPRNYYTARTSHGQGMIYADYNASSTVTGIVDRATKVHPCSEAGMNASPSPTYTEEFTFERASSPGFFDPPLQYLPPQLKWDYHPVGWESALAAELTKKGIDITAAQVKTCYDSLVSDPNNVTKNERSHVIYHPADRGTAVFKGEPAASMVARWGIPDRGFSLIIVCPLVRTDGIDWDRIYDTHNRPPIYTRWSTGEQALCEPVVLMCLPKPETLGGRESYFKDVYWFSMDPTPNSAFETIWTNMWKTYDMEKDIPALTKEFGFPTTEFVPFAWTLVMLQYRVALGSQISDDDLGSWIQQYGMYRHERSGPYDPEKDKFNFDKNRQYSGRQITHRELTGWILNPRFGNGVAQVFAKRWDDAFGAMIAYCLDRTDAKWDVFREKMEVARTVPW